MLSLILFMARFLNQGFTCWAWYKVASSCHRCLNMTLIFVAGTLKKKCNMKAICVFVTIPFSLWPVSLITELHCVSPENISSSLTPSGDANVPKFYCLLKVWPLSFHPHPPGIFNPSLGGGRGIWRLLELYITRNEMLITIVAEGLIIIIIKIDWLWFVICTGNVPVINKEWFICE